MFWIKFHCLRVQLTWFRIKSLLKTLQQHARFDCNGAESFQIMFKEHKLLPFSSTFLPHRAWNCVDAGQNLKKIWMLLLEGHIQSMKAMEFFQINPKPLILAIF